MPKINPEHVKALIERVNQVPYFQLMNMKVCELNEEYARVEIDLAEKHMNPFHKIHGGVYCSILDTTAYWAVYCHLDENTGYTSLDLSIDYIRPCNFGKFIAIGKLVKIGRSICIGEVTVQDGNGKMLAHGTSKLMAGKNFQPINHVMEEGCGKLPPKFLDV